MKFHSLFYDLPDWNLLERKIASLSSEKDKGDAFEEFCRAYLNLLPEYQFMNIWLQGALPSHIVDRLHLSGQKDQGIDLVAETMDGKIWAVQAKFRSNSEESVSYKELSTFLAISDRADFRLIISNTQSLPSVIHRRKDCGEVLLDRLNALDADFFKSLEQYIQSSNAVQSQAFLPREHQKTAIRKAKEHYSSHDRGQLIMACGSGKTLTSVWIAEALNADHILIMVPSLALMRQTISVWAKNFRRNPFRYLCMCSDASVAFDESGDLSIGHLWEMDIPVTTDVQEVSRQLKAHHNVPLIVFSTYQSSDVLCQAVQKTQGFSFDLTICDEAHRTAGMAKGLFNRVLDEKYLPSKKRLFMTATPRIIADHIIRDNIEEDVELFSMADESKYGKEFFHLSFYDAIQLKLLSDYKVVIAFVTDQDTKKLINENQLVSIEEGLLDSEAEDLAKRVAVLKAVAKYGIKHIISFHSRVSSAQSFVNHEDNRGLHSQGPQPCPPRQPRSACRSMPRSPRRCASDAHIRSARTPSRHSPA